METSEAGTATTRRRAARRQVLWSRGVEAIQRLGGPRVYICPLCVRSFAENQLGVLTFEDVPPKRLGGRPLLLTCKECNDKGGHDVDHHAITEDQLLRVASGQTYRRSPVHVSFADLEVAAELRKEGNTNVISLLPPPCNRLTRIQDLADAARTWADGTEFQIRLRKGYIPRRSEISWLRSAYLLAFAWLGYRYVYRDLLDIVRAQIREPATRHVGAFCGYTGAADARRIIAIQEPEWLRGIAVSAHGRIVLLPLFDEDHGFYERFAELRGRWAPHPRAHPRLARESDVLPGSYEAGRIAFICLLLESSGGRAFAEITTKRTVILTIARRTVLVTFRFSGRSYAAKPMPRAMSISW